MEWQCVLTRTRRFNDAVTQYTGLDPDFSGILEELSRELGNACAALIRNSGELTAIAPVPGSEFIESLPQVVLEDLVENTDVHVVSNATQIGLAYDHVLLCPVIGGGERLGMLLVNQESTFSGLEQFLCEYAAVLLGVLMLKFREDRLESLVRQRTACQIALSSLSYSEQKAMRHVLDNLNDFEGMIVTSRVAEEVGITRSVLVNGLRKLESAGLIESRSLGMKGTYVRILNDLLPEELDKLLGLK